MNFTAKYPWMILGFAADISEMNPTAKQMISAFLWTDLHFEEETTPLYAAMERLAFSLVNSFKFKKPRIEIAELRLSKDDKSKLV